MRAVPNLKCTGTCLTAEQTHQAYQHITVQLHGLTPQQGLDFLLEEWGADGLNNGPTTVLICASLSAEQAT